MIIPNAVGRLDPVTEAIREGDRAKAIALLDAERKRQRDKADAALDEYGRLSSILGDTTVFAVRLEIDDDVWTQARRDCGWKGE